MGNDYRIMEDIELTCRLYKRPGSYAISVNTGSTIDILIEEIKRVFACNEARDIVLWKTDMPNESEDNFANLALVEGDNFSKLTSGELNRFWGGDLGRPHENSTQIIIDSPTLNVKLEKDEELLEKDEELRKKDEEIARLMNSLHLRDQEEHGEQVSGEENQVDDDEDNQGEVINDAQETSDIDHTKVSLEQLFDKEYIQQGDILIYKRRFRNIDHNYRCKIRNIHNKKQLEVILIRNHNRIRNFESLTKLEREIIKRHPSFRAYTRTTGSAYGYFSIERNGEDKGKISELRKQYALDHKIVNNL